VDDVKLQAARHYLYHSDLHYIPEEEKNNPLWAASNLLFSKFNNKALVSDEEVADKVRDDDGGMDVKAMKKMFDPVTPEGKGGDALYVSTDWKSCPINIHINNIVETNIEKIPINLYCKAIDEYAMLKQQKENHRILGRREFMKFINEMNAKLGYPKLKDTDDPYKYVAQMGKMKKPKTGLRKKEMKDLPTGLIDTIKASINDNEDLALFNEYIYKGDVEIAIELGLKHYFQTNKFNRIGERLITDIRRYNRCVGRWYTSLTSGRPVMEYLEPNRVYVSPFNEPDGRDITSWYIEYDVTFGDFVRMIGKALTKDQLQKVFEKNKMHFAAHGYAWDTCSVSERNAAKVRVGYHEFESQNCDVYAEGSRNGNLRFKKKPYDWQPKPNVPKEYKDVRVEKHYNVWYSHYYIPMFVGGSINGTRSVQLLDYVQQADYIFNFKKVQDMQRYGDQDRHCLSSLVVWKKRGMSFHDIMQRYMPKMNLLWQKYQHLISQTDVHKVYANELVEAMMRHADEGDKKSTEENKMEWLKQLEQTGKGIASFVDTKGNQIDPIKVFKVGYGAAALDVLNGMRVLYNEMTVALSINDVREGIDPKPRTSLGGIQLSLAASNNGTYFIEKGYMDVVLSFANRMNYYMSQIVSEGESDRLEEFRNVVGLANAMAYEAIKDIPMHSLGMYIDNINTDEEKQRLINTADQLVKAGLMDIEVLHLMIKIDNLKYATVLMIMKYKQKQKQLQEQKDKEFNQMMQAKEKDLEIAMGTFRAKEDAKSANIELTKKWDQAIEQMKIELKSQSKAMLDEMKATNRKETEEIKSQRENQGVAA
jgi:hypothetical protein